MKLLLDTCTFLWVLSGDSRLSPRAAELFRRPDSEVFLSAASAWEIAVKHSAGKLVLPDRPERFVPEHRPARAGEVLRSCLDVTLARNELGFIASTQLVDGLRATFDWIRDR